MHRAPLSALAGLLFAVTAAADGPRDTVSVDPETEGVINGALAYLAKNQQLDGSWSQAERSSNGAARPIDCVAMTGYALMALISAGNLPGEGEYSRNVALGMQYLLSQMQPDGLFRDVEKSKYMYSHGIATVALAELYGQTSPPVLRQRLRQLVGIILDAQDPVRGGWRYTPDGKDSDISVTVGQLAALRAAKNAGIAVPQDNIDRALGYIGKCYDEKTGAFCYRPNERPGFSRTAAAIYSLQVCGKYDDPLVKKGSDYLFDHDSDRQEYWSYGCYYAAPAQYMIGGDVWARWYDQMKTRLLADAIHREGVIHWSKSGGFGPIYDTAVFVTILAMPYHYIPLYQR